MTDQASIEILWERVETEGAESLSDTELRTLVAESMTRKELISYVEKKGDDF